MPSSSDSASLVPAAADIARPRVLSGMRPTGKFHLGNYVGALANWVKLQDQRNDDGAPTYDCYFFIADWHALTTDYADPSRLQRNTLDMALDWLAAGLDPDRSTIFLQSLVPQHAELHLLFSMITPLGWLERVPTYKEQQENLTSKDLTTYGFLGYPLLQSADILLYQPRFVPVGQDQVAHVELTREVARRFNSMYKTSVFPEPEALLTPSPKLLGTDGRKMSKSYGNTIGLTEDPKSVAQKVRQMSTNGQRPHRDDRGDPDLCPVGDLHTLFSPLDVAAETRSACRAARIRCQDCKALAADSVSGHVAPIHARYQQLQANKRQVWDRLLADSELAARRAKLTLDAAMELVGISRQFEHPSGRAILPRAYRTPLDHREFLAASPALREIPLKFPDRNQFSSIDRFLEEPLLTASKKRVLAVSGESSQDQIGFRIPNKSYEVWLLFRGPASGPDPEPDSELDRGEPTLDAWVLPQKYFAQDFAAARKSIAKDGKIPLSLYRVDDRFEMRIGDCAPRDITPLHNNFDPIQ